MARISMRILATASALFAHCSSAHTSQEFYNCEKCGKALLSFVALERHRERVHAADDPGTPHQCDLCKKVFSSQGNLNKHKKKHTDGKAYPCDKCEKIFPTLDTLKLHQYHHTGKKLFKKRYV